MGAASIHQPVSAGPGMSGPSALSFTWSNGAYLGRRRREAQLVPELIGETQDVQTHNRVNGDGLSSSPLESRRRSVATIELRNLNGELLLSTVLERLMTEFATLAASAGLRCFARSLGR